MVEVDSVVVVVDVVAVVVVDVVVVAYSSWQKPRRCATHSFPKQDPRPEQGGLLHATIDTENKKTQEPYALGVLP